jgi:iron complex outermembrane receptor protein
MIGMVGAAVALGGGGVARAQDVALPEPTPAQPTAREGGGEPELMMESDREIDLSKVVLSAAKGVTTVQEAPSIITIITSDEIKSRGFRTLQQALSTIPGWMESYAIGNQAPLPLVRGVQQAALLLHDGISMFDPWANLGYFGPTQPLENIKRIEVVTGPGGVLWGANSFLGIVNLISKDAEDVNGLEVSAGYGDGSGYVQNVRAYAMFGKTFLHGKLKLFQHLSYDTFIGQTFDYPQIVAQSPAPQPVGPTNIGPANTRYPERSWLITIDGKYSYGPVSLYYAIPIGELHPQLTFGNIIAYGNRFNHYDRYGILEYKDRYLKDRIGLTVKGYYTQFVRDFVFQALPPSFVFPVFSRDGGKTERGGLLADLAGQLIQRAGGTVDVDVNLPYNLRLLFGGELFYEGISNSTAKFPAPKDAQDLPFYCPVDASGAPIVECPRAFINDASRVVGALFVNAQARVLQNKLAFDAGVRLQKGWGNQPYDLTPLYSAAVVWNFFPDYHLKVNYATGFRPPVFENLVPAIGGINYGAANLRNESSQSLQGEVNAQLLRNVSRIRELEVRADYSYTFIENLIQIRQNEYGNSGKRAMHSAELYLKLYLSGDHFIQASYTFLSATASDVGYLRYTPNHWFTIGGSVNVVKRMLDFNMNLNVFGAYEDPNHYPSGPGMSLDTQHPTASGAPGPTTVENSGDLTFDRLMPVALLQLGVRLRLFRERVTVSGQFYNVLNQHYYRPDAFYDVTPSVEQTPLPAPGFNFFTSIAYHP